MLPSIPPTPNAAAPTVFPSSSLLSSSSLSHLRQLFPPPETPSRQSRSALEGHHLVPPFYKGRLQKKVTSAGPHTELFRAEAGTEGPHAALPTPTSWGLPAQLAIHSSLSVQMHDLRSKLTQQPGSFNFQDRIPRRQIHTRARVHTHAHVSGVCRHKFAQTSVHT